MRYTASLLVLISGSVLFAQVDMSKSLRFVGPPGTRHLEGLASPQTGSSAIAVQVVASGIVHWTSASNVDGTLTLQPEPPIESLTDGLLLRFLSPFENTGAVDMAVNGSSASPLLRTDGTALTKGALRAASAYEVLYVNATWYLMDASTKHCPSGTIRTVDPVCMDVIAIPGLRFYQAVEFCAARGGKLCTWDEYAVGCALQGTQLEGLFNEWEWIDDTSNHTHSANQAGRFTCQSQRSANVLPIMTGDARCCYQTR